MTKSRSLRGLAGSAWSGAVLALASLALAAGSARAQVEVRPLTSLDLFSAGRDAGFGMDLWKGASADIARMVIPTLASKPLSPAGASLARRLLAQAATAPDGAGADADLAAARVRALLALGEARLADNILDRTPNLSQNALLSQTAAEAALITGQDAKACAIGDGLVAGRDGLYWLRLRAYCQVLAGKNEAAQLTVTLADQQAKDPVLARLMGALLNPPTPAGAASLRNGLDFALSRRLNLDLKAALSGAPPAIAEEIAAAGAPPAPPTSPLESDVLTSLKAAKSFADFVAAAKLAQPALTALVQAKAPLMEPVLDAAAALAAGDIDTAQAIRASVPPPAGGAASPLDLAILDAALASAIGRPDAATLDGLLAGTAPIEAKTVVGRTAAARVRARAESAAAIFAALGGEARDSARAQFLALDLARGEAPAARLLALDLDADAGRVGETALLALWAAQTGGAAGPAPADRARIIHALGRVGRHGEAQAFAVEGLLSLMGR